MTTPVQATLRSTEKVGRWRVYVYPPGQAPVEVTLVRGAPTQLGTLGFSDPFGPTDLQMTFPTITIFDGVGVGDLSWLVPQANVDIVWEGYLPKGYPDAGWRWEGYLASFDYGPAGLSVSCVGAMMQLDNYLAKPEYTTRPIPYEWAISRQFSGRPDLRVSRMKIEWPSWWKTRYTAKKGVAAYLVPTSVVSGDNWTGLVTRQTGNWDPVLSSYVNTLLQAMYTERGRWTLDLAPGRRPILRHRDFKFAPDAQTIVVDPVMPNVTVQLSVDWSQTLNAAYGQGTSLTGVAYSGMNVSNDGRSTFYTPLAALRQVEPPGTSWYQPSRMRKEVNLQLQTGLDLIDARKVASTHLARFSDPGVTGTVTLGADPSMNGQVLPRSLIKAGMSVQLLGVLGRPEGLLAHITQVSVDLNAGTTTLTVDSKYRDQLTVDEVRMRGRDALSISRGIIGGQFRPVISDMLYPWNYGEGSGYIPSSKEFNALRLFKGIPPTSRFPWEDWTTKRPPGSAAWRNCYIRIGPAKDNASKNWGVISDQSGSQLAIPIRTAQEASVRLLQIAAYDKKGRVMKVPFHVSFWNNRANVTSTPELNADRAAQHPPYKAGQYYPFFADAWEQFNRNGTTISNPQQITTDGSELIRAYGNGFERAGHWPGSSQAGDPPTGLLVDESTWQIDTTGGGTNRFDPRKPRQTAEWAGLIWVLIYCDAQADEDVFFLGRMYRVEPGTGAGT